MALVCHPTADQLITQAVRPGFRCPLSFLFFLRSVTNRRLVSRAHASLVYAYGTWNLQKLSWWNARLDSMISRAMKSQTNKHTVCGRPILKIIKRFWKGSVCKAYEISIHERTFWVNLSRIIIPKDLRSYQLGLSTLQLDKKHLPKRHRNFRRDRVSWTKWDPSTNIWATRAESLENLFLLFTNVHVSVWVQLSKMLWKTS